VVMRPDLLAIVWEKSRSSQIHFIETL